MNKNDMSFPDGLGKSLWKKYFDLRQISRVVGTEPGRSGLLPSVLHQLAITYTPRPLPPPHQEICNSNIQF
jgi:hypothetical protein